MIAWAVESLIAVTALMLLVLVVRRPVARFCGAEWAYALWLLPLLRLLMPPLPGAEMLHILPSEAAFIPAASGTAAPPPSSGGPGQWVPLLALWAGGAAAFIIWQILGYRRLVSDLLKDARPGLRPEFGGIPVLESEAAEGPLAIGILRRRIVVPPLFDYRYSAAEQELALLHELIHHRRRDLHWNSLALLVLALLWFNPVAYFAFRAFRADQELACDAAVLRRTGGTRRDYANALVKSASKPGEVAACPLNSADQLKRRLEMMNHHCSSGLRSFGGAAALAILAAAGLGASAPGFAQERDKSKVEKRDIHTMIIKQSDGKPGRDFKIDGKSLAELRAKCAPDNKQEADVSSGTDREKFRTRVIICSDDRKVDTAENRAKLAKALEEVRARVGSNDQLSEKGRAEAAEALKREIARLRAEGGK